MSPAHVLDDYYLAITFLISLALQGSLFAISFTLQTDKLTDAGGSVNFFILALFTLIAGNTYYARNLVASIFVLVWSARLGGFLFYRILNTGKDGRFDEMRSKFFSFGAFWLFQLFWVWTVSLPLTILNSPNVSDPLRGGGNVAFGSARDIAGMVLWSIGFITEIFADQQKFNHKQTKPPKGTIPDYGVWKYSRHPNFFGEIFLWWGFWILCLQPAISGVISTSAQKALYASVLSPIFITLLLFFVSGLPLAEKPTAERYYLLTHGANPLEGDKWKEYQAYLARTSILIPLPPALYRLLPTIVKRTILLDFPMFQFDEIKDGPLALEKEQKKLAEVRAE